MPDDPVPDDATGRAANARLRSVAAARAAQIEALRAELVAERELGAAAGGAGAPAGDGQYRFGDAFAKERTGAKEARRARQQPGRERRKDRRRGGEPGHHGPARPGIRSRMNGSDAEPPAECRRCGTRAGRDGSRGVAPGAGRLDHYQTRLYQAWHRYVTLAMLALAWLAVTRASLADDNDDLVTSAHEIRRMFTALCGPPRDEQHIRHWSRWRHRHKQRARHCHYQRQQLQDH